MDTIPTGGPPTPPFRQFRGGRGHRRAGGFWSKFAGQSFGFKLNVIGSLLGILAILGYLVWLILPKSPAQAQEAAPPPEPTMIQTVAPLESPPQQQASPGSQSSPEPIQVTATAAPVPTQTLTADQVSATATFVAAIHRPAALNNPQAAPYFVGVISYEAGCKASNLGFTTSGYSGEPYYLYLRQPLDRNPMMEIVQISGYIQELDDCQYPVIFVEQLHWMGDVGTPSPLATATPITGTATITSEWGQHTPIAGRPMSLTPVMSGSGYIPPSRDIPGPETPIATYTPYPTYTPQPIPPTPKPPNTPKPLPTYTPYPTPTTDPNTPTPTITLTPTSTNTPTPIPANLTGPVVSAVGCPASNLAIQTAPGEKYFIIFNGASLPEGQPTDYVATAVGVMVGACNAPAILATSITWYIPTPTHTPTITPTSTSTPKPTWTPTVTATLTSTVVISSMEVANE